MPTKITVTYDNPTDPDAFETHYAEAQERLAAALPGALHLETSKVWPKEDGTPTPKYRTVEIYFPDYDTAAAAVTTPAAQAFVTDVFRLGAPVTMLFSEVRTSTALTR
ncbi:EthD family reductase [Desertihabitans aurantiacus]|uniref:EthD family reductase n=1 Tax=Desertihabitans aurantiacus TaxID=2282477 RepID=UPI000DF812AC|nr:EthD family reductase [Desertihabitans aurantiacus]